MELYQETVGDGPNVLLVSGLNGKAQFWQPVAERLAAQFRLVAFDQRGCGASADDGVEWTIKTLAEDATAVAERVFKEESFSIIGHSTGGAVAQFMASHKAVRVKALVLSGTWLQADTYMKSLFDLRLSLLDQAPDLDAILSNLLRSPPDVFAELNADIALDPGVTQRRIRALLDHCGAKLVPQINQPSLVIGASDDRIVPIYLTQALAKALPKSELFVLPGGGHFFPQTHADTFCRKVRNWFENIL